MATANAYRIVDWNKHFENNRTRQVDNLRWVSIPNKHDGDGYTELVCDHPNGPAHYGCWVTVIQVASKCQPRGTLLRDGDLPHDAVSLARKTRLPRPLFDEAIPRFLQLGWLEVVTVETSGGRQAPDIQVTGGEERRGEERSGEEGRGSAGVAAQHPVEQGSTVGNGEPPKRTPSADVDAVVAHYRQYHPKARPGTKERGKIAARLREDYTVDELCEAIDGCHKTPHNLGANERGATYLALELICRDSDHVARYMENNRSPPRPRNEREQRVLSEAERWVRGGGV